MLDYFVSAGKPVLGICRGMQVINVFFGGTLLQNVEGHSQVQGQDRLHRVRNLHPEWYRLYGPEMTVNSAHHQAVDQLGRGLQIAQMAENGIVEAFVHETLPIWGVQWHPERLGQTGARLFQRDPFYRIPTFSKKLEKT